MSLDSSNINKKETGGEMADKGEPEEPPADKDDTSSPPLASTADAAEEESGGTPTVYPYELSRSERKRDREKRRRSEFNNGLDRLMELVFQIDPQLKEEAEQRAASQAGSSKKGTAEHQQLLSRVELINAGVATLERVNRENEERKMVIGHLSRGLLLSGAEGKDPHAGPDVKSAALSSIRNAQRNELQQELMRRSLRNSAAAGAPHGLGAASFSRPPLSVVDSASELGLGSMNPMASSLSAPTFPSQGGLASDVGLSLLQGHNRDGLPASLGQAGAGASWASRGAALSTASALQSQQGGLAPPSDGLSLFRGREHQIQQGAGGGDQSALYRAILDRKILEGEEARALSSSIGGDTSIGLGGAGGGADRRQLVNVAGVNPALLSRSSEVLGPRMSGDSIRQAMIREHAAVAAAAAASRAPGGEEGQLPSSKRPRHVFQL